MVKLPHHCGSLTLLLILMLFTVCPAQADTLNGDRDQAVRQSTGYYNDALKKRDPVTVLNLETDWTGKGTTVAVNTSEEDSPSPGVAEKTAKPEFDSFWAWLWDYLYNGASITLGVGTRQAELGVTRVSDDDYGKIVQRDEEAYFISYSTRTTFMGTSRFAYTFMLNYSTFNMDKQEIGKDNFVDVGTRVKGDMAYVVPALFYQWGEGRYSGTYARIGFGIGLGVTRSRGDVQLFPSGDIVSISDRSYDLNSAYGVFAEARIRHIGIRISAAGPGFEDDEYKYNVSNIAFNLGYSYYF